MQSFQDKIKNLVSLRALFFAFCFLLFSISLASAQGQLYCYKTAGITCVIDLLHSPNPDCQTGYVLPNCSPNPDCCQSQNVIGVCENVPCILIGATPTNTPIPSPTPYAGTVCGSNFGGSCFASANDCPWDAIYAPGVSCTPALPACCLPIPPKDIGTCPPDNASGAQCKTTCNSNETPYSGLTICKKDNMECCLVKFAPDNKLPIYGNTSKQPSSFIDENQTPYVYTAIGYIAYEARSFVNNTLTWSVGLGGAITFIVIIWGSILIITGGHDPKKIQAGQEMITAVISGMIMIIICILLINYLGDKVLNLGPLGFKQ